jgi:hypothetical protein
VDRLALQSLHVGGPDKPTAGIDFGSGLTFITGYSDTGKSYVLDCINFALASSDPLRHIPEADGYEWVCLQLSAGANVVTIRRRVGADQALLYPGAFDDLDDLEPTELPVNVSPAKSLETLSGWLADRSGFDVTDPILRSARGKTQALSFRTFAHLVLVSEMKIITEQSPVMPPMVVNETAAKSVFGIMLTGEPPSEEAIKRLQASHAEKESAKQQVEVLLQMTTDLRETIDESETDRRALEDELRRIDDDLGTLSEAVSESGQRVRSLLQDRNEAIGNGEREQLRAARARERVSRFRLLKKHYSADVERLQFVLEGGHFFNQIDASHCPHCGQPIPEGEVCHPEKADFDQIEKASRAEIKKLSPRLVDLTAAIVDSEREAKEAIEAVGRYKAEATSLDKHIRDVANPDASKAKVRVKELTARRREIEMSLVPYRQLDSYNEQLQRADVASKQTVATYRPNYESESITSLKNQIARLLTDWKFPFTDLLIDLATNDLVMDGKPRRSSGKGVRAVTHAAYTVGLMHHCLEAITPHPGTVVLDTPLHNFKGMDDAEEDPALTRNLHAACLHSLAGPGSSGQTIVIDNEDPPAGLPAGVVVHRFSGPSGEGRQGFFPIQGPPAHPT